jgi:hypothetical protein
MDLQMLLERAGEFDLDEGILLTRTSISAHKGALEGWIISAKDYLLSRHGWRSDRKCDDNEARGQILLEEPSYDSDEFIFECALDAARFYECHCTGKGVKPAFQLAIVRLRDYLSENFGEKSWKTATETACSLTSGKGRHDR